MSSDTDVAGPAGTAGLARGTGRDIAVIGMAVRLPEADDLEQYLRNLRDGRDSVRALSADRIARTSLPPDDNYQLSGFLDDIDSFDHAFFGISKGEAQYMAPEHRLLLQVAYQAVENAGYGPSTLEGVRGSVYVADTKIEYGELILHPEPMMRMGTHVSAMAGRLSRFFGLRGTSTMIDSACSASLLAVHQAVNDLLLGDSELAMVCGASINVLADHKTGDLDIGIRSADGKARAFSAAASGTGSGEAVAVVLLKPLDAALRDGDTVQAVIKATAANNDSSRSSTLTAPDSSAQAEVIELAWRKAGIDPTTISYIEAHGTGTPLGDPIEIEGLDLAFGRVTDEKHFVAVSTVKSNLGHTWSVSGLVGLIKAILSLRTRQLFPSLHAAELNPLIDFANSAVSVTRELTPWEPSAGIRRAGVSSFGVIGTNVHAVLEEAAAPSTSSTGQAPAFGASRLVPISAKSPTALTANAAALRKWLLERPELDLCDVERTLTAGRDHHQYRMALTATTVAEVVDALATVPAADRAEPPMMVLLLSDSGNVAPELLAGLRAGQARFDELYEEALAAASRLGVKDDRFAFQYSFVGLLQHLGLDFDHVVAQRAGKLARDAAQGRITLADALREAVAERRVVPADIDARVDRLLATFGGGDRVTFVEAGPLATISQALAERAEVTDQSGHVRHLENAGKAEPGTDAEPTVDTEPAGPPVSRNILITLDETGLAGFLGALYAAGARWRWSAEIGPGRRIELPSYQFDRVRCWLDDSKLRAHGAQNTAATAAVPATIEPFEAVLLAWQDVLGEAPGEDDSFFDLGGDSIAGLQVMSSLSALFAVQLDEYAIFDHDTPQRLVAYIRSALTETAGPAAADDVPAIGSSPEPDLKPPPAALPASSAQLNIWVASQFDGGSEAFNLTRGFRLDGHVDSAALQRALNALAGRHDALRTAFAFVDGVLTQSISAAEGFVVPLDVRRSADARPVDADLADHVQPFAARPFDLAAGPLIRLRLESFPGDAHILTLSTHHIVADGWSLEILVRDLSAYYAAFARGAAPDLPALEIGYRDLLDATGQREGIDRAAAAEYWLEQYADVPAALDLPVRSGIGGGAFSGTYRDYALTNGSWERLRKYAKTGNGTVFTTVVSAFAALLSRYTDQRELVVGTSLSGRGTPGSENVVAMLVRTLPLRVRIDEEADFRTLCADVRSRFTAGARNGAYSYEDLLEELQRRGLSHAPHLFDVLIEFEQFAGEDEQIRQTMAGDELRMTSVDVTLQTSVFPLNIMLSEHAGTLAAVIRFDTRLFDAATVDQLWESFAGLLDNVLKQPDTALRQIPHLTPDEQRDILTHGAHDFDFDASRKIHLVIEQFARATPDRVCLVAGPARRTYAELNARANQIARFFRDEYAVRPEQVVAVVMDRSIATVEAILALWKCGAAYLPVDPGYPTPYVRSILDSSQVNVVAVDPRSTTPELRAAIGTERQVIELTDTAGAGLDDTDLGMTSGRSTLSYVIYTSGSTGVPKGVMVEHLGMLNHLHSKINDLSLTSASIVAQNASSSFDISVWQMFAALYVGGKTVIYQARLQLDPVRFGERLDADGVTVLEVVPSYLDTMLEAWERAGLEVDLPALAHLVVTGEAVLPRSVNRWLARYPHIPVVNAYGPTEASDDVTHHVMREPVTADTVPLGSPIHNTFLYVLDADLRVCPRGTKGEIFVSGIGVSRGYLHAPEQTARVFLPDPFHPGRRMYRTGDVGLWTAHGTLEYLGRTDSQVKVRGFRIDLAEIERRVDACPGVKAAVVLTRPGAKDRLCAYVILQPGHSVAECRAVLQGMLPQHMIPADFVEIDAMPLTSNGKIDRASLAQLGPDRDGAGSVAPRTETERVLVAIWREVLGVDGIGIDDPFFEIGGNSLRAVQILSRIRSYLGVTLELKTLFLQPTIAALAGACELADGSADQDAIIVDIGGPGIYPVANTQDLLLDMESAYDRPDGFNRNDLYELRGEVVVEALERSFARLVDRHETLRTTFTRDDAGWAQQVHSPDSLPLPFTFHDFAGRPAADARLFAEDRIGTPFDLGGEPLMRVDLLRTDEGWLLVTSLHQLITDGRTVDVLLEEWLRLYDAEVTGGDAQLPPLAFQYKDMARWRNARMTGDRMRQHREFWSDELKGATSVVPLTLDRTRPVRTALAGGRVRRSTPLLAMRLTSLASAYGVTEFVVAKTAVSLLLLAETGGSDVVVGTYTRGRNRLDLENQLGNYINTVPLRTRLRPDDTVASVLRVAQHDVLRAFQHEEYPYGWTMRDLGWQRGPERSPLFDVMVAIDLGEAPEPAGPHEHLLTARRLVLPRRAKEADLQFVFDRAADADMEIAVTYNSEVFDVRRVEDLARRLEEIIQGLAENLALVEILKGQPDTTA